MEIEREETPLSEGGWRLYHAARCIAGELGITEPGHLRAALAELHYDPDSLGVTKYLRTLEGPQGIPDFESLARQFESKYPGANR